MLTHLITPTTSEMNEQSFQSPVVGMLNFWDTKMEAFQSMRETLRLFDSDLQLPGVLITTKGSLVGLIPREQVYEKLGRPFGVELFLKLNNRQFYEILEISTLVLPSTTTVDEAVNLALKRDRRHLYDPLVIEFPEGYGIISMYVLLTAQQLILQDLFTEVNRISTRDPLTLVNNRRGFFDVVHQKLAEIREFNLEYAYLMIDIDKFKSINDRYGHLVGDEVIKSVARKLSAHIRKDDIIGRFGGEEFIICLVGIAKEETLMLAERLRQDIASSFFTINGFQIRVTISIGIGHSQGAENTLDQLLAQADQAVYAAKNLGRNQVVFWEGDAGRQTSRKAFRREEYELLEAPDPLAEQTAQGLLRMLYLRDYETEAHTLRVMEVALRLASKAGLAKEQVESFRFGCMLHDIGKIAIPDRILFKQETLTPTEWAIMQKHPEYARELLVPLTYYQHAVDIPYCHHEHWDGSGYPRGLKGEEIPLAARIFTLVDVWDALSSDRPYRAAWREEKVRAYLTEQSGLLFDPTLVPLFLECLAEI